MAARLQQLTVAVLVLASAAWAWHFLRAGAPIRAAAGVLAIGFAHGVLLGIEFALAAWLNRDEATPPLALSGWLAAWWTELWVAGRVFGWQQPFRAHAYDDRMPEPRQPAPGGVGGRGGPTGVLLVHGYLCNRGLWNPWLARLQRDRVPFIAVNLEPLFAPIDGHAAAIEAAVQRLFAATGRPVLVVAHSMGGLAVRAWLDAATADADPEARLQHVFTIGTPHRGTWLARFGRSTGARQMRLGDAWHGELAGREPAARFARFTCFYSHCDNIVAPASSATLPGADNRHLAGSGHVRLLYRPEVFDAVWHWLAPPSARTGKP